MLIESSIIYKLLLQFTECIIGSSIRYYYFVQISTAIKASIEASFVILKHFALKETNLWLCAADATLKSILSWWVSFLWWNPVQSYHSKFYGEIAQNLRVCVWLNGGKCHKITQLVALTAEFMELVDALRQGEKVDFNPD